LAEEVSKAMLTSKLKIVAALVFVLGAAGAGVGALSGRAADPDRTSPAAPAARGPDEAVERLRKENERLRQELTRLRDRVRALEDRGPAPAAAAREVRYKGKPASYWLEALSDRDPAYRREAVQAV
jgi:hypothetical protein